MFVVATLRVVKVEPAFDTTVSAPMPNTPGAVVALPGGFQNATLFLAKSGWSALSNPEGPTNAGIARLAISVQKMVTLSAAGDAGALAL
jgi:hypothetical protein